MMKPNKGGVRMSAEMVFGILLIVITISLIIVITFNSGMLDGFVKSIESGINNVFSQT